MVAAAIAGNISAEATTPTGNTFAEAMRGKRAGRCLRAAQIDQLAEAPEDRRRDRCGTRGEAKIAKSVCNR
jgi:hypothetical protein